jgi:hypothetical protein
MMGYTDSQIVSLTITAATGTLPFSTTYFMISLNGIFPTVTIVTTVTVALVVLHRTHFFSSTMGMGTMMYSTRGYYSYRVLQSCRVLRVLYSV